MRPATAIRVISSRPRVAFLAVVALLAQMARAQFLAPEFTVRQGAPNDHDVGVDGTGGFVHVWEEGLRISGRRFARSGAPLGSEALLGEGAATESAPKVAVASDGSFFVVWADSESDPGDVKGRRFAASGAPATSEFRINTTVSGTQAPGDVAVSPTGSALVVWVDSGADGDGQGIFAQRFAASGAPVAAQFRVNTYTAFNQRRPVVAATGQGGFVVAWQTYRLGSSYDVQARVFNAAGMPVGLEVLVQDDEPSSQDDPAVGADGSGRFVLVWASGQVNEQSTGIYGQRFDAAGVRLGAEFRVNTFTTSAQNHPSVHVDSAGRFVVAFHDSYGSLVRFREFSAGGVPKIGEDALAASTLPDAVPIGGNAGGDAVVAWHRQDGQFTTVLGRRMALSPDPLGPELLVNTSTALNQWEPAIAVSATGMFVVAWSSRYPSYSAYNVMAQRFSANGVRLGSPVFVSDVAPDDRRPAVGMDGTGEFVVVWRSTYLSASSVNARRYSGSGAALGGVTAVAPDFAVDPDVDRNAGGAFVIVWSSLAGNDIYGRRFASSGAAAGAPFRVNTNTAGTQETSRVALDGSGNFVVVWASPEDGSQRGVFAQRFGASGQTLGPQFRVNALTLGDQYEPDAAFFANGEFVVAWTSYVSNQFENAVLAQRFAASGSPLGAPLKVSVDPGAPRYPRVATLGNEGFGVVWRGNSPDHHTRARLFRRDGTPVGTAFLASPFQDAQSAGVGDAAFGSQAFDVVWQDDEGLGSVEVKLRRFSVRFCGAGDVDGNGAVNVSDVLYLINHLFAGGPAPTTCANANGDLATNVADVLYLINYLFAGGPIPI